MSNWKSRKKIEDKIRKAIAIEYASLRLETGYSPLRAVMLAAATCEKDFNNIRSRILYWNIAEEFAKGVLELYV